MEIVSAVICVLVLVSSLLQDAPCVQNQEVPYETSALVAQEKPEVFPQGDERESPEPDHR